MIKLNFMIVLVLSISVCCSTTREKETSNHVKYTIEPKQELNGNFFKVKVEPNQLSEINNVYNFVSTVPGVYDKLDYGRMVSSFKAFDSNNNLLSTKKISINRWQINDVSRLAFLEYEIGETFSANMKDQITYLAGTEIDSNHVFINTFGVMGYFENKSDTPIEIELKCPSNWKIGTALIKGKNNIYYANSFEQLADSPILAGKLNRTSKTFDEIQVDIYVTSSNDMISAKDVLSRIEPALESTSKFLGFAPVDRYTILMDFLDEKDRTNNNIRGIGALEHRSSSSYILSENERILTILNEWVAHEFFHIAIPLNLHSDVIRPFNFIQANFDQHLWLYEGVTVWASEIMLLRSGFTSLETYLDILSDKISSANKFSVNKSLTEVSMNIYSDDNPERFDFIDNNGSLAVLCLDILILDHSKGEFGFREILIDLMNEYGANKSFPNAGLFSIITNKTNQEVGVFIEKYIQNNETLPYNNYLSRIGLRYYGSNSKGCLEILKDESINQASLREKWMKNI